MVKAARFGIGYLDERKSGYLDHRNSSCSHVAALGMIIPLNLVKLCGLVAGDSVLLVQNLGRIGLVGQVRL
jgi:hypothetical protein